MFETEPVWMSPVVFKTEPVWIAILILAIQCRLQLQSELVQFK